MSRQRAAKMMRFTLLCLVISVQSASEAFDLHDSLKWPPGATGALGNKDGFNATTNSSMIPASSGHNETAQWNGTTQAIQNSFGFLPPSAEGHKNKEPKLKTVTTRLKPFIIWHPLKNRNGSTTNKEQ